MKRNEMGELFCDHVEGGWLIKEMGLRRVNLKRLRCR